MTRPAIQASRTAIAVALLACSSAARGQEHRHHHGDGWVPFCPPYSLGGLILMPAPVPVPVPIQSPPLLQIRTGLMLPEPAPARQRATARPAVTVSRSDIAKAAGYLTIGDRLFRAGNFRRAEDRYLQAIRANPRFADPRIHLAQIATVRGDYGMAADFFRGAITVDPGWLAKATDIQSIYAEPADFHRAVAALESHLQTSPDDRDGWLVLGAQLYLSGKTRDAANVFLRLADRRPDATLAAFLDASNSATPLR